MSKKLAVLLGLGFAYLVVRRHYRTEDRQAAWEREAEVLGLPKSAPIGSGDVERDAQGRRMVSTLWGYVALEPGEKPGDESVHERAREEARCREVNRFYEQIAREREKVIPPGSCLKRDRWGCLFEKNPNGLGWREFGSEPEEPYTLKANGSW